MTDLTSSQLRALRERLGLTQAELAKQIGTTRNTIARWERDKMRPSTYAHVTALQELAQKTRAGK